jgi:hypothetical protein
MSYNRPIESFDLEKSLKVANMNTKFWVALLVKEAQTGIYSVSRVNTAWFMKFTKCYLPYVSVIVTDYTCGSYMENKKFIQNSNGNAVVCDGIMV